MTEPVPDNKQCLIALNKFVTCQCYVRHVFNEFHILGPMYLKLFGVLLVHGASVVLDLMEYCVLHLK